MARLTHFMDSAPLSNTFTFQTNLHSYQIKWGSLGASHLPPLVFVHGTPWSSRVWAPFAVTLSRHFHVYLFDNPGFGESPLGTPLPEKADAITEAVALDANLAEQTKVFAALYKTWENDGNEGWAGRKAHVIAHDHAGLMTLRASLLHGCEYASLCLIDVVAMPTAELPLFKLVAEQRSTFEQLPATTFRCIVEGYIRDAAHHALSPETMKVLIEPWLSDGGQKGFIRQLCQANSRSTDGLDSRYGEVGAKLPVKVIWGQQDGWVPVETATALGKAVNAAEVTVIEDAGHLIMYDQGEALGTELGWWLSKVSGKP
ncbi:hypothetical protein ACO1O0_000179 [Amphichorda felina]